MLPEAARRLTGGRLYPSARAAILARMTLIRRWLVTAGVACAFGLSGWCCSTGLRNRQDTAADAVGWVVFAFLLGCSAAVAGYVIEFVEPARPRGDRPD